MPVGGIDVLVFPGSLAPLVAPTLKDVAWSLSVP
jgi:hypothetical protein